MQQRDLSLSLNKSRETHHWGRSLLYLVAYGFSVKEDFFLQEFKKTWREELEVLDIWLLGRTRSLEGGFQTVNLQHHPPDKA